MLQIFYSDKTKVYVHTKGSQFSEVEPSYETLASDAFLNRWQNSKSATRENREISVALPFAWCVAK